MTTANKITMIRVIMLPLYLAVGLTEFTHHWLWATLLFALASVTDFIDGRIARKYNQITTFGKFVDPLADKLLVISALLVFTANGGMPVVCTFIIIARELIITSLRILAMGEGTVMAAALSGKIKTFTQMVLILVMMLASEFLPLMNPAIPLTGLLHLCSTLMALVTLWSGCDYLWRSRELILKSK